MSSARKSRRPSRVQLGTKITPSRPAGRSTFEDLLNTAGHLLGEVGFEGLSTNLICERAGMTPPALYRYFPNKYAVLQELGRRLMQAQDAVVYDWLAQDGHLNITLEAAVESNRRLQTQINRVTRKQPGGVWILRALRALPLLAQVRIASREEVARRLVKALRTHYPQVVPKRLLAAARLSTEVMYAATEMTLESPSQEAQITEEACWMVCLYYRQLRRR